MGCHASGYDKKTQKYVFEGVVCSTCHYTDNNAKHPPAPFKIANQSASCGACHSGAHAPTYDEWLISAHNEAKIDCVDCHTPHNNGLKQGDVNSTCGNCHKSALDDKVHMGINEATGKQMTCIDCHMTTVRDETGAFALKTGHSMAVEPDTCGNCHGAIHELKLTSEGGAASSTHSTEGETSVTELQAEVTRLRDTAQTNWATGIAGGAIGMLLVIGIGVLLLRRGRLL
jgi:nitrate/TMAO reductase-like tetraheme cytochrome c subunit